MFENKHEPLLSASDFRSRIVKFFLVAFGITIVWLAIGAIGFHYTAQLSWEDAFYNAAMMVSAMGPVFTFSTTPAKIFAALYALGSGLAFVGIISIVSAPVIHRFFHYFHLEANSE